MFGNSMICDPWGQILTQAGDEAGVFSARLDLERLKQVRSWIPMDDHRVNISGMPVAIAKAGTVGTPALAREHRG